MSKLDDHIERLRRLVSDYSTTRPPSAEPLEVAGPFDRDSLWKTALAGQPGCYVIYCEDGSFKYTGMSEVSVGGRIGNHLSPREQGSAFWREHPPAAHFCLITTPAPEARALEAFLQSRGYYYREDVEKTNAIRSVEVRELRD